MRDVRRSCIILICVHALIRTQSALGGSNSLATANRSVAIFSLGRGRPIKGQNSPAKGNFGMSKVSKAGAAKKECDGRLFGGTLLGA